MQINGRFRKGTTHLNDKKSIKRWHNRLCDRYVGRIIFSSERYRTQLELSSVNSRLNV